MSEPPKKRPLNACDVCDAPKANLYYHGWHSKNWLCDECFKKIPSTAKKWFYRSRHAQQIIEFIQKNIEEDGRKGPVA